MKTIKEFKEMNDDTCLNKSQANLVVGGATSNPEKSSTNTTSGYGYSSDYEIWTYSDSGLPISGSVWWLEGGTMYTRPIFHVSEVPTVSNQQQ